MRGFQNGFIYLSIRSSSRDICILSDFLGRFSLYAIPESGEKLILQYLLSRITERVNGAHSREKIYNSICQDKKKLTIFKNLDIWAQFPQIPLIPQIP